MAKKFYSDALAVEAKSRANHTGTQPISSIDGLQLELESKADASELASIAFSGSYADLADKPNFGSAAGANVGDFATAAQGAKADSAVQPAALDTKVDKVAGKGLSTEDYSTAEKTKLASVAANATANETDAALRDRTTHTGSQAISTVTGLQTALDDKQATLVSGSNLKTVGGVALLGSGDIPIGGALPAAMSLTYTSDRVTKITEDGVDTNITYNSNGTVNTISYPVGAKTRTETYNYTSGQLTGMTATEV